nr:phosphonate ABC transporter, permease protein PhnE [Phytoactinopolyspora alkaliphila]
MWFGLVVVVAITVWSMISIEFTLAPLFTDLTRGAEILERFFDPNWEFAWRIRDAWMETLYIAVIAAVVGNGVALFLSMLASKITNPNTVVYQGFKTILSVVRSLPDIAYGLIFAAAVGNGALAGILALIMFNIGINAKLTSETIDAVDVGPLEAADAAGGSRIQRAWSAVVPQILPNYTSYSLYVFELNIRASVVIGIVGGGGIGQVIRVQLNQFQYENLGAVIFALFVVVFLLDRVSVWIRRRLV